jgi:hypothetical protein
MGQFSVDGGNFNGPYRCWKCRTLYTLDMVNSAVVSLTPLSEAEFKEIKAKQDAQKKGYSSGGGTAHAAPQTPPAPAPEPEVWPKVSSMHPGSEAVHADSPTPPAHADNPVVWPRVANKVVEQNTTQEPPKQSFTWPKAQKGGTDLNTESGKPSAAAQAPFVLPGEMTPKKTHGVVLFQTLALLAEAEKVLDNEGCTISRITAPVDPPSGSNIALRFSWTQYETVKASLEKAGVKTQGIIPF